MKKKKKKEKTKETEWFAVIVQVFNDKKEYKETERVVPSALYLFMSNPILFEDISKIKCCDKYGKQLYYLLLIRYLLICMY